MRSTSAAQGHIGTVMFGLLFWLRLRNDLLSMSPRWYKVPLGTGPNDIGGSYWLWNMLKPSNWNPVIVDVFKIANDGVIVDVFKINSWYYFCNDQLSFEIFQERESFSCILQLGLSESVGERIII